MYNSGTSTTRKYSKCMHKVSKNELLSNHIKQDVHFAWCYFSSSTMLEMKSDLKNSF